MCHPSCSLQEAQSLHPESLENIRDARAGLPMFHCVDRVLHDYLCACGLLSFFLLEMVIKWWKRDAFAGLFKVHFRPVVVGDQPPPHAPHGTWRQRIARAWKLAVVEKGEREVAEDANRQWGFIFTAVIRPPIWTMKTASMLRMDPSPHWRVLKLAAVGCFSLRLIARVQLENVDDSVVHALQSVVRSRAANVIPQNDLAHLNARNRRIAPPRSHKSFSHSSFKSKSILVQIAPRTRYYNAPCLRGAGLLR